MAKAKSKSEEQPIDTSRMTKDEAMQIIEAVARGIGSKQQTEAAKEWLRINGAGEIFTKYQLEIVHTYKTEKQELPELKI